MTDEKKKELFPYFAFKYSKELNPDKYGQAQDIESWTKLISSNQQDIDAIAQKAATLSDEEWSAVESEYADATNPQLAKKGAKLVSLNKLKAGKKVPTKAKKCKCGCDMIDTKEAGGKIVSSCSCKCNGGKAPKAQDGKKLDYLKQLKK